MWWRVATRRSVVAWLIQCQSMQLPLPRHLYLHFLKTAVTTRLIKDRMIPDFGEINHYFVITNDYNSVAILSQKCPLRSPQPCSDPQNLTHCDWWSAMFVFSGATGLDLGRPRTSIRWIHVRGSATAETLAARLGPKQRWSNGVPKWVLPWVFEDRFLAVPP